MHSVYDEVDGVCEEVGGVCEEMHDLCENVDGVKNWAALKVQRDEWEAGTYRYHDHTTPILL